MTNLSNNIWKGIEKGRIKMKTHVAMGLERRGRHSDPFKGKGLVKTRKFWGV